jgi:2-oxoglutarate ferredoxin oxidoreductase subunit alpha
MDQTPLHDGYKPFDWDPKTGLSKRPIPGQKNGMYTLTGLAHNEQGKVTYQSDINQHGSAMRSRKLATFGSTLKPPTVNGDPEGDILLVGWGSTYGAITEATDRLRKEGHKVSSVHLRFLSPMEPGLKEIFSKFKKVMTVELNYSDDPNDPLITPENRRYSQLAWILRARTLVDIDCYSNVHGRPLRPGKIIEQVKQELVTLKK